MINQSKGGRDKDDNRWESSKMAEKVANNSSNSAETKENIPQSNGDKPTDGADSEGVKIGGSYLVKRLGNKLRE